MKQLEELQNLFPVVPKKVQQSIKGGGYHEDTYWGGWLDEVVITPDGYGGTDPYTYDDWQNDYGGYNGDYGMGGGYYDGGGAGGGGASGGSGVDVSNGLEVASLAIANGLAFDEFYTTLDAARTGDVAVDANSLIKNVIDNNPYGSFVDDIRAATKFNGVAILSTAGKVLGVTQAIGSVGTLADDILDGNGVSMVNVADAAINVGSLFIKSNIVGATVSFGWLLIKGEFLTEEEHAAQEAFNNSKIMI